MTPLRVGLVQFTATDSPAHNTASVVQWLHKAADQGANFVLTPEVSNFISSSREQQAKVITTQENDQCLREIRALAKARHIWVLAGSLAIELANGRYANRSFLIDPTGAIAAYYDKIHMFDVDLGQGESYRESRYFQPGNRAVIAQTPFAALGLTICYDLRFPHLFRTLAKAGAGIITVPSAFTVPTGKAHWHSLLTARAIETGCFILAPAMVGRHSEKRASYGHSLVVSPWGEILADGGTAEGVTFAEIDLSLVEKARAKMPSLAHDRKFSLDHVKQ